MQTKNISKNRIGKWLFTALLTAVFALSAAAAIGLPKNVAQRTAHAAAGAPDTSWYDGHESDTVFDISTPAELAGLASLITGSLSFTGKTINLIADIDLEIGGFGTDYNDSKGWIPIGTSTSASFQGAFNGGGHEISGLYIKDGGNDFAGLFGCVEDLGTVENLSVRGTVEARGDRMGSGGGTGGIVSLLRGSVKNCRSFVNVTAYNSGMPIAGGIAGYLSRTGKISDCYAECEISTLFFGGGIAGFWYNDNPGSYPTGGIFNCMTVCKVTVTGAGTSSSCYAGGIIGNGGQCPVKDCIALGESLHDPASLAI